MSSHVDTHNVISVHDGLYHHLEIQPSLLDGVAVAVCRDVLPEPPLQIDLPSSHRLAARFEKELELAHYQRVVASAGCVQSREDLSAGSSKSRFLRDFNGNPYFR